MNANEPSPAFRLDELKLLPDWMKEDAPAPPGAVRGGEDRFQSRGNDRGPRRDDGGRPSRRPGGGFGGGGEMRGGGRPTGRGDRDRGNPRRPGGGGRDSRDRDRGPRPPEPAPVHPARVRVEFLPDPRPMSAIAKEIRGSHLAYPLFGLARMFLDRPERHRIRLAVETRPAPAPEPAQPGQPPPRPLGPTPTVLFQLGEDGPVASDRAALERIAFDLYKDRFYLDQSVQKDPPKGNFTNVARDRLSGTLLGPTNYHAYQANLRGLYESRFSRRMDFEEFRRGVEIVSDPALVERWKEEVRTITTYVVRDTLPAAPVPAPAPDEAPAGAAPAPEVPEDEVAPAADVEASPTPPSTVEAGADPSPAATDTAAEGEPAVPAPVAEGPAPVALESLAEARQHFRQHYFEGLLRTGSSFELPGPVGRQLPEASLTLALRFAHEREVKYPAGLVQPLRAGLQGAGLHIFKHRKRIVYVSASRPTPFRTGGETGGAVSGGVSAILETVAEFPMLNRKQLADRILARRFGPASAAPGTPVVPVPAANPEIGTSGTPEPAPADPAPDALARAKAMLAADLRYLVQAGHVIEFYPEGTLDLPLLPRPKEPTPAPPGRREPTPAIVTPAASEPAAGQEARPAPEAEVAPLEAASPTATLVEAESADGATGTPAPGQNELVTTDPAPSDADVRPADHAAE